MVRRRLSIRASAGPTSRAPFRYVGHRSRRSRSATAPIPHTGSSASIAFRAARRSANPLALRVLHPWSDPSSRVRHRFEIDSVRLRSRPSGARFDPLNPSRSETRRTHARVQTDASMASSVSVSGGFEWLGEKALEQFHPSAGAIAPVERRVIAGAFGEARWTGSERMSVQGGVRAEHITRKVSP